MCLYQTHGRRPPDITGRFVNTMTRGWVGAPNERAPFRIHGAVVGFVDRCLSRTRNLAASNQHVGEFFSGRSWLPRNYFFGVFEKFETLFSKICAYSERHRNLLAGISEIRTSKIWQHSVSIVTGLNPSYVLYNIRYCCCLCCSTVLVSQRGNAEGVEEAKERRPAQGGGREKERGSDREAERSKGYRIWRQAKIAAAAGVGVRNKLSPGGNIK